MSTTSSTHSSIQYYLPWNHCETDRPCSIAESREHRATGERPQPGSLPAQAKSAADKATTTEGHVEDHVKAKLDSGVPPTKEEAR